MSKIILDFGSAETCKNDKAEVKRMLDALFAVDSHNHEVFIKWQLFLRVPSQMPPLDHDVFDYAYKYAADHDYCTFASVFDEPSLEFLLGYRRAHLPAVKMACRPELYEMLRLIPRDLPVYISVSDPWWPTHLRKMFPMREYRFLYCIPEYPAQRSTYELVFGPHLEEGISDHTDNLAMYKEWQPVYYERHFKLPDSTGLDAGPHASTPEELGAIL